MFPINASLFAHLEKHVTQTKPATQEKNSFPIFSNIFVAKKLFPICQRHMFSNFSSARNIISRLFFLYFILLSIANRAESPQQHVPVTVGLYCLDMLIVVREVVPVAGR